MTNSVSNDMLDAAAEAVRAAKNLVAITGAGVSVESGIPDFRSPQGLWQRFPPEEYATIEGFHADPDKVWEMWYELGEQVNSVQPNPAHHALAELERMGILKAVITQNIDNLHHEAGNSRVIEYHGNVRWMACPACFRRRPLDLTFKNFGAPMCECGGRMKPEVIFFGEDIPQAAQLEAQMHAQTCDALIIVGTSANVYPAADLPFKAKEQGAYIIECNLEPTDFTHKITDAFLQGAAGEMLPELVRRAK